MIDYIQLFSFLDEPMVPSPLPLSELLTEESNQVGGGMHHECPPIVNM